MSRKERDRMGLLLQVKEGGLTLKSAASRLGLSYRQAKRVWSRWCELGDAGLLHGLRGRASNNRAEADPRRELALGLWRERYAGMGPTLAAQLMAEREGLSVDHETLRGWGVKAGLWQVRHDRSRRHRRWRPRKACFGELVQFDGSHHAWFGEDRPKATLMVMVDDATGWVWAQFFEAETTQAAMSVLRGWIDQYGLPLQLYPDRHSIHRQSGPSAVEHKRRTGAHLPTQFGRALDELGIELRCAHSPQAKGRVERVNGVLQDRLVQMLKLDRITTIDAANTYLRETFLPAHNARFAKPPADDADAHRPPPSAEALDAALCLKDPRAVGSDGCVQFEGRWLQLTRSDHLPRRRPRVEVRQHLDGRLELWRDGHHLPHQELTQRPATTAPRPSLSQRVAQHAQPWKPPANHAWRQPLNPRPDDASAGARLRCARPRCAQPHSATPATRRQGTVLLS